MSTAHRYLPNYTLEDYQQWKGDWELWQGIPVSMSPSPFGRHQECCANLIFELKSSVKATRCRASVLCEIDWIVSDDTVVRPDLVVLCGGAPERHVEDAPAIIAEVLSPSTEQRDRTAKFDLYQDNAVKYYLMIDPDKNALTAFELDEHGIYRERAVGDELSLEVCDGCCLQITVANLFG